MNIAIDIGGVTSKYPNQFKELMRRFDGEEVFIITDMHDKDEVLKMLQDNEVYVNQQNVYCADYKKYGDMCKAVLLAELKIDIFIDDFAAYLNWDSSLGPAPIRLLVMPDPYKPYWDDNWKVKTESDFGRRRYYGGESI